MFIMNVLFRIEKEIALKAIEFVLMSKNYVF
jgi:hypothetical protein